MSCEEYAQAYTAQLGQKDHYNEGLYYAMPGVTICSRIANYQTVVLKLVKYI
jgi:hypothetical protein